MAYPADAELRTVGQGGDRLRRRSRVLVGQGLAGQRVRVVEAGSHVEVDYGSYRVRHIAAALRTPHGRL